MNATEKANVPGILLMVAGLLFLLMNLLALLFAVAPNLLSIVLGAVVGLTGGTEEDMIVGMTQAASGAMWMVIGILVDALGIIFSIVIMFGGNKLRQLQSPGVVYAAAILAILQPTVSMCVGMCGGCGLCGMFFWVPLWLFGIAAGSYAIVTMNDPDVRAAMDAAPVA